MTIAAAPADRLASPARPPVWARAFALAAVVFGLATVKSGAEVAFDLGDARAAAGAYVPYVVWFNFLAGFAYVAAGIGLWRLARWARRLTFAIALATLAVGVAFALHVTMGGAFEIRTVGAMGLRIGFWAVLAVLCLGWERARA